VVVVVRERVGQAEKAATASRRARNEEALDCYDDIDATLHLIEQTAGQESTVGR
jgi:hypothetical protein